MMDIAYGFKGRPFQKARTTIKVYALVFVCLLTSATNILALESIETQEVAGAVLRHSSRYGVPAEIFVDSGTQLVALKSLKFSIRNLDARLYDAVGIRVSVSTPKAHQEQGRVERKIRSLREMLEKTGASTSTALTPLQWETKFAQISNMLDDIPIAKGKPTSARDFGHEILTPNRLKLGRNNSRSVGINVKLEDSALPSNILDENRKISSTFYNLLMGRIHELMLKPKERPNNGNDLKVKVDDIVLFLSNETSTEKDWKLGRVVETDGRKARIYYMKKSKENLPIMGIAYRSLRDISLILSEDEVGFNSKEYWIRKNAQFNL